MAKFIHEHLRLTAGKILIRFIVTIAKSASQTWRVWWCKLGGRWRVYASPLNNYQIRKVRR